MEATERAIFLRMAWLSPDREFLGVPMRPLSLGSEQMMRLMGLRLLEREATLTDAEMYREMTAYLWLHREPLEDVAAALWSGGWRAMVEVETPDPLPLELLAQWTVLRERIAALLEASEIAIRPRPRTGKEDRTPHEVRAPESTAHMLATVARVTGERMDALLWEMPIAQVRQVYHAEMRWNGFWTVYPAGGDAVTEDDFEGFGEDVLGRMNYEL